MSVVKKRNFKAVDMIARSALDGKVDIDITFSGSTMKTTVYVKLDASLNIHLHTCKYVILTCRQGG